MTLKELYKSLIKEGKKHQVSEIDIRYLISYFYHINNNDAFFLSLEKDINNNPKLIKAFKDLIKGVPLAYIIGESIFLGDRFIVNKSTLIPRMETEELVVLAVNSINKLFKDKKDINIIDVGTGSGVIAIKLKKEFINAKVYATDISKDALKIARLNAKNHHVDIKFYHTDTFPNNKDKYDVIISNPPYIKYKKDIDKSVIDYEPLSALLINNENNVYRKIFADYSHHSSPCIFIFEIAPNITKELLELIRKYFSNKDISYVFSKDINKKTRFLTILIK